MRVRDIHVADVRVADVTAAAIPAAMSPSAVTRIERFTPSQREPAEVDADTPSAPAEADADTEARTADPAYQGGRIIRIPVAHRPRRPSPVTAVGNPAAIVEGSKTPRLIVNPGPSPGSDPNPVPEAVRSPTRWHCVGNPHVAVIRSGNPASIAIKILITDHARRYIARGQRVIQPLVANLDPIVKSRRGGSFIAVCAKRIAPLKRTCWPEFTRTAAPPPVASP